MNHHCHANDCPIATPPRLFMCVKHWGMVPPSMQKAVWAAYRANPTGRGRAPDYLVACAEAVEHVATSEGKPINNSYRRTLAMLAKLRLAKRSAATGESR